MKIEPCISVLSEFIECSRDLYVPLEIEKIDFPSSIEFYRKYVSQNLPVVIRNAFDHWPAMEKWNMDYFSERLKGQDVSVNVTPDGYGDCIHSGVFVKPEERKIPFSEFRQNLNDVEKRFRPAFYISAQNDSLREEYPQFLDDVEPDIPLATEALGRMPEAVNLWIGDARSVSSLHQDHYENMYCVVRGAKHFILHPPMDLPFLYKESYPTASYHQKPDGSFEISMDSMSEPVPWVAVDVGEPDFERYPLYRYVKPLTVTVEEGEMLYLPSLWFHYVAQSGSGDHPTIAVNYWYDVDYDAKYVYQSLLTSICEKLMPGEHRRGPFRELTDRDRTRLPRHDSDDEGEGEGKGEGKATTTGARQTLDDSDSQGDEKDR
eukprot:TRINITY_DN2958_c0_g1::TRINITY_DN2958_c0_g1_i1::g.3891::m.3891 TRINITY_DN2958_c0_g1::TRINITY_DN2958_c0_g1_i1::g.3891  ORF type:complete len:376 (+),score=66.58,sp/P0C870/JMJD7_HUMAN/45.95/2e-93,Cupin_8/PF13621.1/5e-78,Cupin_4/PF08007.7/2.9e+03,Cupin_4/PF08007.7/0.083,JmjC/PF02373.17/5.5e+03,JmjC/PF02373.17/0.69 TRINITY_DN2958_c0_g1_i1:2-1129(+)